MISTMESDTTVNNKPESAWKEGIILDAVLVQMLAVMVGDSPS